MDVVLSHDAEPFRSVGGTAANVALILAFLGWDVSLAGQLGDDVLADEFEQEVREAGASASLLRRAPAAETARLLHRVDADGHAYAYTCPRCHQRFPRSRPLTLDLARQVAQAEPCTDVYFFDRVGAGTIWLAEHYAEAGATVVFEPSLPTGGDLFRRACEASTLIKHSAEIDLPIPSGPPHDLPHQVRVITSGAAGLTFRVGNSLAKHLPAIPTLAIDTAGAGDWTTAALLYRACDTSGFDLELLEDGLRLGQALAAVCCSVVGARSLTRLTPRTVLRRGRAVLAANSLEAAPRLPSPRPQSVRPGRCSVCLLRT